MQHARYESDSQRELIFGFVEKAVLVLLWTDKCCSIILSALGFSFAMKKVLRLGGSSCGSLLTVGISD